jgi:hypothetical protein
MVSRSAQAIVAVSRMGNRSVSTSRARRIRRVRYGIVSDPWRNASAIARRFVVTHNGTEHGEA